MAKTVRSPSSESNCNTLKTDESANVARRTQFWGFACTVAALAVAAGLAVATTGQRDNKPEDPFVRTSPKSLKDWKLWDEEALDTNLIMLSAQDERESSECAALLLHVREAIESGKLSHHNRTSVVSAISEIGSRSESGVSVFVMLNGNNFGVEVPYVPGCDGTFANIAINALGVRDVYSMSPLKSDTNVNPLYLYSPSGFPVGSTSASDFAELKKADYMLHVLRHGELFMWPGIEVGFEWDVAGVRMKTLSMEPRVYQVSNLIHDEQIAQLVTEGGKRLYRSPEKHYSNDDRFKNYRTSETGSLDPSLTVVKDLRKLTQRLVRLPTVYHVENLMFLRYTPGKWYKEHQDTFHNFSLAKNSAGIEIGVEWVRRLQDRIVKCMKYNPNCSIRELGNWLLNSDSSLGIPSASLSRGLSSKLQNVVCKQLVKLVKDTEFKSWLSTNIRSGASNILVAVLSDPDTLGLVHQAWIKATFAEFESTHGEMSLAKQAEIQKWFEDVDLMDLPKRRVEWNRFATLLPYLSHVEEGGETVFPYAKDVSSSDRIVRDGMPECSRGLHVKPVKGGAALFYHVHPSGGSNRLSTHGGCPPVRGRKDAMNVFMWNVEFETGYSYFAD